MMAVMRIDPSVEIQEDNRRVLQICRETKFGNNCLVMAESGGDLRIKNVNAEVGMAIAIRFNQ